MTADRFAIQRLADGRYLALLDDGDIAWRTAQFASWFTTRAEADGLRATLLLPGLVIARLPVAGVLKCG